MAVETRYAVVRKGVEVLLTTDKKEADEYDKMVDTAELLELLIHDAELNLDESIIESLSIHLAKNKHDVLVALGVKKPAKKTQVETKPATQDAA